MDDLGGKVAVVTGGGSGIGRALCIALAESGCDVVVADIEPEASGEVVAAVEALSRRAVAVQVDVADATSVESLATFAFDTFGRVDVLCNNAGVFVMGPIVEMIPADWEWLLSVNVMGVVHGIHAFVPRLIAQSGPAHILNTSSVAALGGGGGAAPYAMTKAAVLSISESLRDELAPHGIGVTVLCPGNISSRILGAQRNRPAVYGRLADEPFGRDLVDYGLDPIHAARRAVRAIRADELYAFAYPGRWGRSLAPRARTRYDQIVGAIDAGALPEGEP